MGRIVGRGVQAALALAVAVMGLTWLNRVAASVMAVGGSCGSGGPYEIATPCPDGAWMAPAGILLAIGGLGLYVLRRPSGGPQLLLLAWPALFGSLGIQFLRAARSEGDAYGFWLCGLLFLAMAAAPVVLVMLNDRTAVVRAVLGTGEGEPSTGADERAPSDGRPAVSAVPGVQVTLLPVEDDRDLAHRLERLSRLHRCGALTDAEYSEAKQQVLERT